MRNRWLLALSENVGGFELLLRKLSKILGSFSVANVSSSRLKDYNIVFGM